MLQSVMNYMNLPKIQLPTLSQLRDGSFLTRAVQKYEDEREVSILKDFESKLVKVQEVAVWSNPTVSVIWVLISQLILYYFFNWTVSLVSTVSYIVLSLYMYTTWVYTVWPAIKVPPAPGQDDQETWTPVHPDVLSAPELQTHLQNVADKIKKIEHGLILLRQEQPGRFCTLMSLFFIVTGGLGVRFSLPVIIHMSVFLLLILPGVIIRCNKNQHLAPCISFLADVAHSMTDLLVYRGLHAPPPDHSHYLAEFEPETSEENESVLGRALTWRDKTDTEREADYSLAGNMSIPSHEDVENESLNTLLEFEQGMQPLPSITAEQSVGAGSETESEDEREASEKVGDYNDSDSDSLELDPRVVQPPPASTVASESLTSNISSLIGSFISNTAAAQQRRHSNLSEEFEFINQDELNDENI